MTEKHQAKMPLPEPAVAQITPNGPLAGLRVVELGRFVAAPYASRLLADLGADVIKIEGLAGDPFRNFVQARPGGLSSSFTALNRNKRCLAVDLSTPEGRRAAFACIASADVFVENSRPGAMDKLGLGYEQIRLNNPGLVYCSISGFGEVGPYVGRPGYDMIGQAVSGMASQLLDPAAPQIMGPNLADSITGMTAAYSVLAALHSRSTTGLGQRLTLNLVGSALAFLGTEAQRYLDTGVVPGPLTRPAGSLAFVLRCSDEQLMAIHLSSPPKFWRALLMVVDDKDLASDQRFMTHHSRQDHYLDLREVLRPIFAGRESEQWLATLTSAGVPCAMVNDMSQVFEDEQVRALGLRQGFQGGQELAGETVGVPIEFSGVATPPLRPPPLLGEHTLEILRSLGFSDQDLDSGVDSGWLLDTNASEARL